MLSGSADGTVRVWDSRTGQLLASLFGSRSGQWLAMTPAGFFAASGKGTEMLGVVRGLEAYSVMQFYDHLHRPDLVEELLKGDPEGKYKDASRRLNLETILDSGPRRASSCCPTAPRRAARPSSSPCASPTWTAAASAPR